MSPKNEQQPKKLSTVELLNPKMTPEAAFQSYTMLVNNSGEVKEAFLNGDVRDPEFEYPQFFRLSEMDQGILALQRAIDQIERNEADEFVAKSCVTSLEFRQAEMEYVKLLGRIDFLVKSGGSERDVRELVEQARGLNHELYGRPDPEVVDMARNEIWEIIDQKELHPSAEVLRQELRDGFSWNGVPISGLGIASDSSRRLPRFEENDALNWAGEYVVEKNSDIQALVYEYWEDLVDEFGEDYTCGPEDIMRVFQAVIDMRDPDHDSGVSARIGEGATALSWESGELAVVVGSRRAAIKDAKTLFNKVMHEFGMHGQRCINGMKHKIPVMATGVYTETARPDYLTAEEGFATTIEEIAGDKIPVWDAARIGHYLNIAEVEDGNGFRAVFEKAWRYRLLASIGDSEEVTEAAISKAKTAAYSGCIRIFRGQPNDITDKYPGVMPLSYNKDLAYLNGRVIAMRYFEECYKSRDTESIDLIFAGKFDPTVADHLEIAKY